MVSSKDRRNSGRFVTKIFHPVDLPYEEEKWNDWDDHRDGFRDTQKDGKLIYDKPYDKKVEGRNKKNFRKERIRKVRKE